MIHPWYVLVPLSVVLNLILWFRFDLREAQYRVINWERLRERRLLLNHTDRKESHA